MRVRSTTSSLHWRRTAYRAICALLVLGTFVLGYLSWQQMRAAGPQTSARHAVVAPNAPPAWPGESVRSLWSESSDGRALAESALWGLDPTLAPLEAEPAGLEPPPQGQRQWAFVRNAGDERQEVAAWRIDGASLDELAGFYERQAQQRGFEPLSPRGNRESPGSVRQLNFAVGEHPLRVLSVRLEARGGAIHVLIALR